MDLLNKKAWLALPLGLFAATGSAVAQGAAPNMPGMNMPGMNMGGKENKQNETDSSMKNMKM